MLESQLLKPYLRHREAQHTYSRREDYKKSCAVRLEIRLMRRLGTTLPLSYMLEKSPGPPVLLPSGLLAKLLECLNMSPDVK